MDKHKPDRRVSRTRRHLREAFWELILEKGYDAVTIEDITDRAELGRTTFYLHYRDKDELLLESIEAISAELKEQVFAAAMQQADRVNTQIPIQTVFQHAAENANLYRVILHGAGGRTAYTHMHDIISQSLMEFITHSLAEKQLTLHAQIPLDVFSHYFAGALLGFLTWWLEAGMPYSPEEMTEIFRKLFFQGGRSVLTME